MMPRSLLWSPSSAKEKDDSPIEAVPTFYPVTPPTDSNVVGETSHAYPSSQISGIVPRVHPVVHSASLPIALPSPLQYPAQLKLRTTSSHSLILPSNARISTSTSYHLIKPLSPIIEQDYYSPGSTLSSGTLFRTPTSHSVPINNRNSPFNSPNDECSSIGVSICPTSRTSPLYLIFKQPTHELAYRSLHVR